MARGFDYVGVLPEDYGAVGYPTVEFAADTVLVFWHRQAVQARPGDVTGRRMWSAPLGWFYEDEPPLPAAPKLELRVPAGDGKSWNRAVIPADFYENRFYCRLSDLAAHLKSPVGRLGHDMYAPLHQVITCLGWRPHYDRSRLRDTQQPQMVVWCTHPHAEPPPFPAAKPPESNSSFAR
jgi:hypothetical protein